MPTDATIRDALQILSSVGLQYSEDAVYSWSTALKGYDDAEVLAAANAYARDGEKRPIPKYIIGAIHELRRSKQTRTDTSVVHDILKDGSALGLFDGVIVRMVNIVTGKIPWDGVDRGDVARCVSFMREHQHDWHVALNDANAREWSEKYGPNWERCRDICDRPRVDTVVADVRGGDMERLSDVMGGV